MDVTGKSALVSGGASGLGRATASRLHAAGMNVGIIDRNADAARALAAELGDRARAAVADVTSAEALSAAVEELHGGFGGVHVAVACAGVGAAVRTVSRSGPMDLGLFETVVRINLVGAFNLVRLAAAKMAANAPDENGERGVLVMTASIAAYEGQVGQAAYAASKAGIAGMTLPIARDLAKLGIRAVTIAPGLFDTPLLGMLPQEQRDKLAQGIPFPSRLGRPAEFAELALHIARNPMLNGEVIRLDGALRLG